MDRQEDRIDGYLVSDIECCVEKNRELYTIRFRGLSSGRKAFNWSAGLFGNYWLSYRLMLKEAVILTLADSAIAVFLPILLMMGLGVSSAVEGISTLLLLLLAVVHFLLMGFYGDRLYWWHLKRLLNSFQCKDQPRDTEKQAELHRFGGTSIMVIVICIFAQRIVEVILTKLAISMIL